MTLKHTDCLSFQSGMWCHRCDFKDFYSANVTQRKLLLSGFAVQTFQIWLSRSSIPLPQNLTSIWLSDSPTCSYHKMKCFHHNHPKTHSHTTLHTADSLPLLEKSMQVAILSTLAKIKVYLFKRPYVPEIVKPVS